MSAPGVTGSHSPESPWSLSASSSLFAPRRLGFSDSRASEGPLEAADLSPNPRAGRRRSSLSAVVEASASSTLETTVIPENLDLFTEPTESIPPLFQRALVAAAAVLALNDPTIPPGYTPPIMEMDGLLPAVVLGHDGTDGDSDTSVIGSEPGSSDD